MLAGMQHINLLKQPYPVSFVSFAAFAVTVATTPSITAPFICQALQPPAYSSVPAPSGLRCLDFPCVCGCRCPSFSARAVWAMKLSPLVPQHPSRTCLAGCMNRIESKQISFNRFRHRAFFLGTEMRVKMGTV